MKLKIRYSPWVFAERREDGVIWLHPSLKKYPKVQKEILKHESKHTGRWTWRDIVLDFQSPGLGEFFRQVMFFLHEPKVFLLYLLPFSCYKGKIYIDYLRCAVYGYILTCLAVILSSGIF